ncbi:FtsJ methyltransferase domain-containing protein 2 [Lunasporangiospora selenospora]|uniref:Cap-specific mRNA (nucleoside-2'-O-)-methyltransferase 1 n=1 Tax=Lunasporangiospora selenospora TaxID=979761 RepID=A0A9P6G1G7_9FUNG|nr:FtsJ methyltransferase domain-containing protein 2 [Lunasporangiospora selenospora]
MDPYNESDPVFAATPLESPTAIPSLQNCPRVRFPRPGPPRGGPHGFEFGQHAPLQYGHQQPGQLRYDPVHGLQQHGGHPRHDQYQQSAQQQYQGHPQGRPIVPATEYLNQHLDIFQAASYELPENCLTIRSGFPESIDFNMFCSEEIVRNLTDNKRKLGQVPQEMFNRARQRCNPYELVASSVFMNRASVKIASMDSQLALTAPKEYPHPGNHEEKIDPKLFRFADLCAGPGGFSEYLLWRMNTWGESVRGWAMTLRGDLDLTLDRFHKDAMARESLRVHYGADSTGNILKEENIRAFVEFIEKETFGLGVGLVVADGGISVDGDEAAQENLLQRLILCQILTMFMILQKGGDFVVKVFDIFTPVTAGLIWILSRHFEKICVVKPLTSRPMNSERYVVCRRLLERRPASAIDHLLSVNAEYQHLETNVSGQAGGPSETINHIVDLDVLQNDRHFMDYIRNNNVKTAVRQTEALGIFLNYVNEGIRPPFDQEAIRRLCLQEWRIPPSPQYSHHSHTQPQRSQAPAQGYRHPPRHQPYQQQSYGHGSHSRGGHR